MSSPQGGEDAVFKIGGDEDCPHESLVNIGADAGNNDYYKCRSCESVILKSGHSRPDGADERYRQDSGSKNKFADMLNLEETFDQTNTRGTGSRQEAPSESDIVARIREFGRKIFRR
ncbi:MAG: hypothetical protein V5A36_01630 [Natronomonas sp.]